MSEFETMSVIHLDEAKRLAFERGEIKLKFRDTEYGDEYEFDIDGLLDFINADHSEHWTDYDKTDWVEGVMAWSWLQVLNDGEIGGVSHGK